MHFIATFYYGAKCLSIRYNKSGLSREEYLLFQAITVGRDREDHGGHGLKWARQAVAFLVQEAHSSPAIDFFRFSQSDGSAFREDPTTQERPLE